jgi:hypothetical protein
VQDRVPEAGGGRDRPGDHVGGCQQPQAEVEGQAAACGERPARLGDGPGNDLSDLVHLDADAHFLVVLAGIARAGTGAGTRCPRGTR